jgi:hypothetical protein
METSPTIEAGPLRVEPFASILQKYTFVCKDENGRILPIPRIPLCRLQIMTVVRPLQKQSAAIDSLKEEFRNLGYQPDTPSFFIQCEDSEGTVNFVTDEIRRTWDPLWVRANDEFEAECSLVPEFGELKDKMFSVLDGNHRLFSWMQLAEENPRDMKYHPRVVAVLLRCPKDKLVEVEMAMHARNS